LSSDAPVVGLLFGHDYVVEDAVDIAWDDRNSGSTSTKINLHKAVFPMQRVLGWYRVGDAPNEEDLKYTKQLQEQQKCSIAFCLMQASGTSWMEDELPVTIYELQSSDSVLVALSLELGSTEPERIAIERVLSQKAPTDNELDTSLKNLQDTLKALEERINILVDFLQRTHSGEIPLNRTLLQQVQELVQQLPILSAKSNFDEEFAKEQEDVVLMSYVATIAKTACAVKSYTEKFLLIYDNLANRESMRRAY